MVKYLKHVRAIYLAFNDNEAGVSKKIQDLTDAYEYFKNVEGVPVEALNALQVTTTSLAILSERGLISKTSILGISRQFEVEIKLTTSKAQTLWKTSFHKCVANRST